ncbi:DUF72 domain-containing protein [Methylocapsa palsarum]|uniref:DUF72 domain-containing protein n=1 Tax=Methylocapsa palsarum TaxID=1612308 RepID=UPI001FCDFE68|nr:DUF72 domain-containing protein [Methylocapsa palsarum]
MSGPIRIGIGGWDFAPWRGVFYPPGLKKKDELAYACARLSAIEINATFYRTQSPATFAAWTSGAPDGFVFAVKAPRGATYTSDNDRAGAAIQHFLGSGLDELGDRLGPILWQLAPTRKFDADALEGFLRELPQKLGDRKLQHAIEARHQSFAHAEAAAILRAHGAARVIVDSDAHEMTGDVTADFVYLRLQRTKEAVETGYDAGALDLWANRLKTYAAGAVPDDMPRAAPDVHMPKVSRPVYAFVISGAKVRAPAAAMALIARLQEK